MTAQTAYELARLRADLRYLRSQVKSIAATMTGCDQEYHRKQLEQLVEDCPAEGRELVVAGR